MRVLITGGGTGGHIYPAISITKGLKKLFNDIEVLYVGTERGLESELVPKEGINFTTITVSGFKRRFSIDTIKTIKNLFIGLLESKKIISSFKPDIVIGTGGYVCGPLVFMASLMNIKTAIHEQNVIPGVTNKILGKFVDKIFISFEDSKKYFSGNENKIVFTGNPIRDGFIELEGKNSKENVFRVLSFGGSRGAKKINDTVIEAIRILNNIPDIVLTHVTGKSYYREFIKSIKGQELNSNIRIVPYIHDMPKEMVSADLVISRSGAITLAEITALGLPSILIPSPNVANNHQEYNARVMEKKGAAIVFLEKDLNSDNLIELLVRLKNDRSKLKTMAKNSRLIGITNATENIINNIKLLIEND